MRALLFAISAAVVVTASAGSVGTTAQEALKLCGDILGRDMHADPEAQGMLFANGCFLSCASGNGTLLLDRAVHEGFACADTGVCHHGSCVGSANDARIRCGAEHRVPASAVNATGSGYSHDMCTLTCQFEAHTRATTYLYEGQHCPGNVTGVCQSGVCMHGVSVPTAIQQAKKYAFILLNHLAVKHITMTQDDVNKGTVQLRYLSNHVPVCDLAVPLPANKTSSALSLVCTPGRNIATNLHEPLRVEVHGPVLTAHTVARLVVSPLEVFMDAIDELGDGLTYNRNAIGFNKRFPLRDTSLTGGEKQIGEVEMTFLFYFNMA